jgi:hypothetical protein
MKKIFIGIVILIKCCRPLLVFSQGQEYYGSFASWTNLKQKYHAVGDGVQDDTKALQTALNELGQGNHSPVLYIPKGTYRITATLTMQTRMGIAIIGEDPLSTIIKWDGGVNQKMFLLNGVSYSEFARITWDGSNKASAAVAHEWDGKIGYANSGTAHTDEIFRNLQEGLKSGKNMDAEFSIRRCRFYNCSKTAIALQGWNALDWWIWDCYFESCNVGVANNIPGFESGNFNVYRSIFKYSKTADISLGNSLFFSFRDNVSYNSNAFIVAKQFSNTSPITLQHNLIVSQKDNVMADLFTKGNVLFTDNTFITPDSNKNYVINYTDNFGGTQPDLTMIGNLFTAKQKIVQTGGGRNIDIDNQYGIKAPALPSLEPKPFEVFIKYPIYEVTNKMTADEIQAIINEAAAKNKKAVIHFTYGTYSISKILQVPAGAPLVFLGDGFSSILKWSGDTIGPLMQLNYPVKAVLRNLKINGNAKVDGLIIYDNDKPGNSIYANELLVYNGIKSNLSINGFANTSFVFENFQHNYCLKGSSVKMIGTGKQNAAILRIFGCASVGNTNTYAIDKNGRIVVYDDWTEVNMASQFVHLKTAGEFILNGAMIANTSQMHAPFIAIDSFSGKAVFAQILYNEPYKTFRFSNGTGDARLLTLGTLSWSDSTLNSYTINSEKDKYAMINNRYNIGKGSYPLSDTGTADNAFLKDLLADMRQTLVSEKPVHSKTGSTLIISRVFIENSLNNFRVEKTN